MPVCGGAAEGFVLGQNDPPAERGFAENDGLSVGVDLRCFRMIDHAGDWFDFDSATIRPQTSMHSSQI
jgi:hypothetical protein